MLHARAITIAATLFASSALLILACGEDSTPIEDTSDASLPGRDSGKKSSSSSSGGDEEEEDGGVTEPGIKDGGGGKDATPGDSCNGQYKVPDLQGAGACGTKGFGEPAALFGPVFVDGGTDYTGTTLADGIYDAINAERASGGNGSWRETFVVKGNRFTRIRQVDTGSGPAPITYRSGTWTYDTTKNPQVIRLSYDCAVTGDAGVDAGEDNLPSDALLSSDCSARYRYGASGIRITLRRRM